MMRRLATLAAFLSGCVWVPDVTRIPAPEGEGVAIEIVRMHLAREHGRLPRHDGKIVWTDDECIIIEWEGHDSCARGLYYPHNDEMFIVWDGSLWESSLTHELIHYWLDKRGDSDNHHTRTDWWSLIPSVQQKIRAWEDLN